MSISKSTGPTSDDALNDELAVSNNSSATSPIIGVLPADAVVLFMNADDVGHVKWVALVIGKGSRQVVDGSETVASKFEVVGHDT